jgi:hypothetical protein
MRGKRKANPWPINFAIDLFDISKEEFQNPEIINHRIFCNVATIKKFKDLTAEGVLDLFDFDQDCMREKRMYDIIVSYYKDGKTLITIGEEHGISTGRVRQIRMKGLIILRVRLKAEV